MKKNKELSYYELQTIRIYIDLQKRNPEAFEKVKNNLLTILKKIKSWETIKYNGKVS